MNLHSFARSMAAAVVAAATLFAHGSTAQAITIDWATVGDIGNAPDVLSTVWNPDNLLFGSVGYEYRISKHEVTNSQYAEFLNDVAASDPFALFNTNMGSETSGGIIRSGSSGSYTYSVKADALGQGPGGSDYAYADKPVVYVSWYDAVRFANWLTSGTTESGTYTITGGSPNLGLVTSPDHATFAAGSDTFFLPTEDEWYKAAYFDGSTYFDYATGSDFAPEDNQPSLDTGNSANLGFATGNSGYPLTDVGDYDLSASPYGTFDQSGNVREWNETPSSFRALRGGSWNTGAGLAAPDRRYANPMKAEGDDIGFRIATTAEITPVPEPSTYVMAAMGLLGLGFYGWRRRACR